MNEQTNLPVEATYWTTGTSQLGIWPLKCSLCDARCCRLSSCRAAVWVVLCWRWVVVCSRWRWWYTGRCTTAYRWWPSGLPCPVYRRCGTSCRCSYCLWSTWPSTGSGRRTATAGYTWKTTCHTPSFSGRRIPCRSGPTDSRSISLLRCSFSLTHSPTHRFQVQCLYFVKSWSVTGCMLCLNRRNAFRLNGLRLRQHSVLVHLRSGFSISCVFVALSVLVALQVAAISL